MTEKSQTTERTRTATTPHGDVEYETVVCSSCGQEVRREDARRFVIGETTDEKTFRTIVAYHFESGSVRVGWACPYCADADTGPIGFPGRSLRVQVSAVSKDILPWAMVVVAVVLAAIAILLVAGAL